MNRVLYFIGIALLSVGISIPNVTVAKSAVEIENSGPRRVLRVSLYPYIPDPVGAYYKIEREFEAQNPKIDLQITLLSDSYYDHRPEKGGILYSQSDVYEIDSVFLEDFLKADKIQPLSKAFADEVALLVPFARSIATRNDSLLGLPHWVCGNFLIFRTDDDAFKKVKTLKDVEAAILGSSAEPRWLIADFSGKSTLGEMYLDTAMDSYGSSQAALDQISSEELNPLLLANMTRAIALVRPSFGRDETYHDTTGFYARQFARRSGRAMVGYSEQLYYAFSETMSSCRKDEGCLKPDEVEVAQWPLSESGSHPIAWVDLLVLDTKLKGRKKADAEQFIRFMAEVRTYKLFLQPDWGQAPRYLLPAKDMLYRDDELIKAAPLYSQFRTAIDNATSISSVGLNARLRAAGAKLDKILPPR